MWRLSFLHRQGFLFVCALLIALMGVGSLTSQALGSVAENPHRVSVRGVIDRIEGGVAVVLMGDDEALLDFPLWHMPASADEGMVLEIQLECRPEETDRILQRLWLRLRELR